MLAADAPMLSHPVPEDGTEPARPKPVLEPTDDRGNLGKAPFVLIVEDDPAFAGVLLDVAHEAGLKGIISPTGSGTTALARKMQPSAITLDLGLSDIDGFVLLDLLRHEPETASIPVHVISGGERADEALALGASQVIEKPANRDTLTRLFQAIAKSKPEKAKAPAAKPRARSKAARELKGTQILIIDDDIRNIYSLTSVLEAQGAKILHAERGSDGIAILEDNPEIDVALVDIMMPDMDGYETMRRIRRTPEIAHIPLVAVTAKAMKDDRQKCLDAGANDYIAKPVDIDLLLALVRVWIDRSHFGEGARKPAMASGCRQVRKARQKDQLKDGCDAKILVVDDDERNLLALSEVLEPIARSGHRGVGQRRAAAADDARNLRSSCSTSSCPGSTAMRPRP